MNAIGKIVRPLEIGDKVIESPVGAGTVTSITSRGYPRVNYVAVALLVREDGYIFDPHDQYQIWKEQQDEARRTKTV